MEDNMSVKVTEVSAQHMDKYVTVISDIYSIAPARMDDIYDFIEIDEACHLVDRLSERHRVPSMVVMHWIVDSIYNKLQIR